MPSLFRSAVPLLALLSAVAHAVHPVVVEGQDFVNTKTNKRLMIVGVDYQIGGESGCMYIGVQPPCPNARFMDIRPEYQFLLLQTLC
jgi:hypothetical protein